MKNDDNPVGTWPHEEPASFRPALERTAGLLGFRPALVEKDYYCSLVLKALAQPGGSWVFKGGTCLSKVYADFYRLSEDLDFSIPITASAGRDQRRKLIEPAKVLLAGIAQAIPGIELAEKLTGRNESTQYVASLRYRSAIVGDWDRIKVEIGMREPLLRPVVSRSIRTLLRDVFTGSEQVPAFDLPVMDLSEALAEKVRAALTRKGPAIRDFYDLDFAAKTLGMNMIEPGFVALVQRKLSMPGNGPIQLTEDRRKALAVQRSKELNIVLRSGMAESFDLDRIWSSLGALVERLTSSA